MKRSKYRKRADVQQDIHIRPEELREENGNVVAEAVIEVPSEKPWRLWFRVPERHKPALCDDHDPFVIQTVFLAMRRRMNLAVHGKVSSSLLRNLAEFQAAWHSWNPEEYEEVEILVDAEYERPRPSGPEKALLAYTGGVDSSFSAYRHSKGKVGRRSVNIAAGVFAHGFEIPLEQTEAFGNAARKASRVLDSIGLPLMTVATNFRATEADHNWGHTQGTAVASCLNLLKEGHSKGLIASSWANPWLIIPWGSSPLTDYLLSSDSFQIIHDGAECTRTDKVSLLSEWPEALKELRSCFMGDRKDGNCGVCCKCLWTILSFKALGKAVPDVFDRTPTDKDIGSFKMACYRCLGEFHDLLRVAEENGFGNAGWCRALRKSLRRFRFRQWWKHFRDGMRIRFGFKRRPRPWRP